MDEDNNGSSYLDILNGLGNTAGNILGALRRDNRIVQADPNSAARAQAAQQQKLITYALIGGGLLLVIVLLIGLMGRRG